jgi:hypothetical protein
MAGTRFAVGLVIFESIAIRPGSWTDVAVHADPVAFGGPPRKASDPANPAAGRRARPPRAVDEAPPAAASHTADVSMSATGR